MPRIDKPKKKKITKSVISKKTKKPTNLPTHSKKTKQNPVEYYNCLLTQAQNNWFDPLSGSKKKITACCKECKLNALALNSSRNLELKKLINSYQQVGDSLKKLLQPIK